MSSRGSGCPVEWKPNNSRSSIATTSGPQGPLSPRREVPRQQQLHMHVPSPGGIPEEIMRGTVEERFWAKVRKTETCWLWTGGKSDGYGRLSIKGAPIQAHRISFEWEYGGIPLGMKVDHLCLVRHCVRPSHLRLATVKQNNENLQSKTKSSTGVRGVFQTPQGQWRVRVGHNKKQYNVGYFDTLDEAEAAAIKARNKLFTHNEVDRQVTNS